MRQSLCLVSVNKASLLDIRFYHAIKVFSSIHGVCFKLITFLSLISSCLNGLSVQQVIAVDVV